MQGHLPALCAKRLVQLPLSLLFRHHNRNIQGKCRDDAQDAAIEPKNPFNQQLLCEAGITTNYYILWFPGIRSAILCLNSY
jgi:hypothetical protein